MLTDEQKRQERLEKIRQYRLMDDVYMSAFFSDDIECTQLVLRILMDKDDLIVKKVVAQMNIKNLQGHSVILDVLATDSQKRMYNIEVQRADEGANVRRARYNSSILDANALQEGEDYRNLPDTYVIFITENDVFHEEKPLYHFERRRDETYEKLGDGSHIIYVNGQYRGDTPLGKLMQDFVCTNPHDMCYDELRKKSLVLKGLDKEEKSVDKITQSIIDDERKYIAEDMLLDGKLSIDEIARYVKLPVDRVKEIATTIEA